MALSPALTCCNGLACRLRAPERVHIGFGMQELPEALRAHFRQSVPDAEAACEFFDIGGGVVTCDAVKPAGGDGEAVG